VTWRPAARRPAGRRAGDPRRGARPERHALPSLPRDGRLLRFVAFLALLAGILAYVAWQWGAWSRPSAAPPATSPAPQAGTAPLPAPVPVPAPAPAPVPAAGEPAPAPPDFFQMARLDRDRARSEAIDLLRSVADDPRAAPSAREGADLKLQRIADRIRREARAEDLLKAKGYRDALVMLESGGATAVVRAASLSAADVARIADAVSRAAGVAPESINVLARR
jgi:hypothetical protein